MSTKTFLRTAKATCLALALIALPATARAAGFGANLEGQLRDTSTPALANLPAGQGVGDGTWTGGGLSGWREGDWIPIRVNMSGGPVAGQQIVVNLDYASNVNLGEAGAFTYVGTPNPASAVFPDGFKPDTIPTTNPHDTTGLAKGLQASAGVTATFVSVSAVTSATTTLTYTFTVNMTGATGSVQFMVRLNAGSHNFGGASLQLKGSPALGTISIFKPAAAPGNPDLSTTKSAPATAAPGQNITYTINYSNVAPAAGSTAGSGVQVVDTLPAGVSYVAGSATCASCIGGTEPAIVSNTLSWDVANLQPGAPAAAGSHGTITFHAIVDPAAVNGQTLTNAATVFCAENDANPANDASTAATTVSVTATDLVVDAASGTYGGTTNLSATLKIAGTATPIAGQVISFSLNGNAVCGGLLQPVCPSTNASGVATLNSVYLSSNGLSTGTPIPVVVGGYPTGTQANYAGQTGPPKYDLSSVTNTLTINKATLSLGSGISITPYNVVYDGNAHTATGSATGVSGEDLTSLLDLTGTTHTDAAAYNGDPWSFAGDSNYNPASGTVNDNISKATLTPGGPGNGTITISGYTVPFDNAAHTATGTATGVSGEDLSGLLDLSGTTHTVAGGFPIDPWSFAGNTNYNAANGTVSDTINLASSTTTVTVSNATYDGNPHGGTAVVTGIALNQAVTVNYAGRNGTVYPSSVTPPTDAGDYTAGAAFAGDANHSGSGDSKDYTISKATLTPGPVPGNGVINVVGYSVTYDGNPHTATGTATGVAGENLNGLLNLTGTTHTLAGTYNGDAWSFAGNANYNSASGTVDDAITKATLPIGPGAVGIDITPYNVTYDGNPHTAAGTAKGVKGEDLSALLGLTGTTHTSAGSYPVDPWTFAGDNNYNSASGTVADNITKATLPIGPGAIGIDIVAYNVVYDAAAHTATGTATGVKGENLNALLNLAGTTHTLAAGYAGDPWSFAGDSNYNSASGTVNDNISKKSAGVTLVVDPKSKTYGAANPTLTGTLSGIIAGDDVTASFSTTANQASPVGGYPITGSVSGTKAANYSVAITNNTLTVAGKALTVSAAGVNRAYDGTTAATVTLSTDKLAADDVTPSFTSASFANKHVGSGKAVTVSGISISGASAGNYTLSATTANTVANITQRAITVTAQPDTKLYDGTPISTVLPKVTSGTIVGGDTGNFTQVFSGKAVGGSVTLTPSGSVTDGNSGNNYAVTFVPITGPGNAITARTVTPSITAASKTYDGTTNATIATRSINGVLSGDTVTLIGGTAKFSDPNAGTGKAVTATSLALNGAEAGNYVLSSTSAATTADITKANQAISFGALQNHVSVDGPFTVDATASSGLPVTLAVKSGPATISGNTVTLTGAGKVTLSATQGGDNNYNAAAEVDQAFSTVPPPALLNISTRGRVGTDDNVLIGGYIVKGVEPKTFAARGIGPSINSQALPSTVVDPVLELHGPDGAMFLKNDNWQDTQADAIRASGLAPVNLKEAAAIATTAPGAYTAIVKDKAEANGIGLVELYDLSQNANAVLANISTRGMAGAGDDVLIGGFIVNGNLGSAKVIMRAIGPSLAQSGITNVLPDPTLALHDSNGAQIGFNDNWGDDPAQAAAIQATGIPPQTATEAAILISLPPGPYTFILGDKNGKSGVALAEVYDLTN